MRGSTKAVLGIMTMLFLLDVSFAWSENGAKSFAFVNPQYIITAEVAGEHSFVVNFINLSDYVIVIQPNEFIYRSIYGQFYIGQVYDKAQKDSRGQTHKYSASILLKAHSFTGLSIIGSFHEQDQIEEASVRIGAKRFYLQPLEKIQFDQLAAKITNLDMDNPNPTAALQEANISEMGTVRSADGTSKWDSDWQGLITPEGVNPPKIVERPAIALTEQAIKSNTYGKVRLSGIVNKSGGIIDLKVVKGLGRGLDERALEAVKNSWVFLPATRNGEVLDTAIAFDVDFPPPQSKQ